MSNQRTLPRPADFIVLRVHNLEIQPALSGLCIGYEGKAWRSAQLAQHIFEWLPEFSLRYTELTTADSGNFIQRIREAAQRVYTTKKFKKRGEFGELFLHAAIRQCFDSHPAVSKIFYKSSLNDTVKGFDAVHVTFEKGGFVLWLGEAKFYSSLGRAISDVIKEINDHLRHDYLRNEFLLIRGKIDDQWPFADQLRLALSSNRSLDEIFAEIRIAVLLTYDSPCLKDYEEVSSAYLSAFEDEILSNHKRFLLAGPPPNIAIHLFLMPLNTKEQLLIHLDKRLKTWQNI